MSPGCSALLGQPSWTETLRTPAPHGSRRAQHSLGGGPPPRPPKPQPGLQRLPEHQHITLITAPASSLPSIRMVLPDPRWPSCSLHSGPCSRPVSPPWVIPQAPRPPRGACLAAPRSGLCAGFITSRGRGTLVSYCVPPQPPTHAPGTLGFVERWAGSHGDLNPASSVRLPGTAGGIFRRVGSPSPASWSLFPVLAVRFLPA